MTTAPSWRTAAVVAVGSELLLGDVVNTNAAWLGRTLSGAGLEVVSSVMVPDDLGAIGRAVGEAVARADLVVVTGGLGPTSDDVTREALSGLSGRPLVRSGEEEQRQRQRYAAAGVAMPPDVLRQADVPQGARLLANPAGSAPGLVLEVGGAVVVAVPGPPHELRAVLEASGEVGRWADRSGRRVLTRTVQTCGLGESAVAAAVEAALELPDGVALSYLAAGPVVRVRFTTSAGHDLGPCVAAAAGALGRQVWGYDDDTLPEVVLRRLEGATVATAESLTGGLVAAALTGVPGSSAVVRGGVVAYATDLKASLAGVPAELLARHGAVSPETALAMAEGVRSRLGATVGLATTGVAGPAEQEGRPVGTVHLAVALPGGSAVESLHLAGDRERVRAAAVLRLLDLLRRTLPGEAP